MSQKELNYIEDIYNHEKLLIDIINDYMVQLDIDDYVNILEHQVKIHGNNINKIKELLGDKCGK